MALNVVSGLFKKRKVDALGRITDEQVPFLPKTISKLVYMMNGESVEHAMQVQNTKISKIDDTVVELNTRLDNFFNGDIKFGSFESLDDYKSALESGDALATSIYVIND